MNCKFKCYNKWGIQISKESYNLENPKEKVLVQ